MASYCRLSFDSLERFNLANILGHDNALVVLTSHSLYVAVFFCTMIFISSNAFLDWKVNRKPYWFCGNWHSSRKPEQLRYTVCTKHHLQIRMQNYLWTKSSIYCQNIRCRLRLFQEYFPWGKPFIFIFWRWLSPVSWELSNFWGALFFQSVTFGRI